MQTTIQTKACLNLIGLALASSVLGAGMTACGSDSTSLTATSVGSTAGPEVAAAVEANSIELFYDGVVTQVDPVDLATAFALAQGVDDTDFTAIASYIDTVLAGQIDGLVTPVMVDSINVLGAQTLLVSDFDADGTTGTANDAAVLFALIGGATDLATVNDAITPLALGFDPLAEDTNIPTIGSRYGTFVAPLPAETTAGDVKVVVLGDGFAASSFVLGDANFVARPPELEPPDDGFTSYTGEGESLNDIGGISSFISIGAGLDPDTCVRVFELEADPATATPLTESDTCPDPNTFRAPIPPDTTAGNVKVVVGGDDFPATDVGIGDAIFLPVVNDPADGFTSYTPDEGSQFTDLSGLTSFTATGATIDLDTCVQVFPLNANPAMAFPLAESDGCPERPEPVEFQAPLPPDTISGDVKVVVTGDGFPAMSFGLMGSDDMGTTTATFTPRAELEPPADGFTTYAPDAESQLVDLGGTDSFMVMGAEIFPSTCVEVFGIDDDPASDASLAESAGCP